MRLLFFLFLVALFSLQLGGASSGCGTTDDDDDTAVPAVEAEPNNDPTTANAARLEMAITGYMSPGDVDYFQFQVPSNFSGYKVTLSVEDEAGDCFTGVDPNLTLLASDGQTQLYWVEDAIEDYCPILSFVPSRGGTYYAVVGTNYTVSGTYYFTLTEGGTGTASGTVSFDQTKASKESPGQENGPGQEFGPGQKNGPGCPIVPGDVLVELSPAYGTEALARELERQLGNPVGIRPVMGGRFHLLKTSLPSGLNAAQQRQHTLDLVNSLATWPGIVRAEPNRIFRPEVVPDDPLYTSQWGLLEPPGLNAASAWDLTKGSSEVVVAVIDTGDENTHEDLRNKSVTGFDFISDPDNAGDGNGADADPDDNLGQGHGVHVAGIAAAETGNGVGIAGVGWSARYMPLRICGNYGCTAADMIDAIAYTAGLSSPGGAGQEKRRADVINLSLGGPDYCPSMVQDAITAASYRGVLVVAAAGNDGKDAALFTPGNCLDVITVGAVDSNGQMASFSNYGPTVDVLAPGVNILSTYLSNSYAQLSGTSMATPHVAGIAALLKSLDKNIYFDSALSFLKGSCEDCDAQIVDAAAILQRAIDRTDPEPSPPALILVQAVETTDPLLTFHTFVRDGLFTITGLEPGVYRIQAGTDTDGDFVLGEPGESLAVATETVEVTSRGEDVAGIQIVLLPFNAALP